MKKIIYTFLILSFFSCENKAQDNLFGNNSLESKWTATDTIHIDLNNDGLLDAILEFNKYELITRPKNIQTPLIVYLKNKDNSYSLLNVVKHFIYSPYFEIKVNRNIFYIIQQGVGDDINIYKNKIEFQDKNLYVTEEMVVQNIEKLRVVPETGDVISEVINVDTVYQNKIQILIEEYSFVEFRKKFR